MRRLWQTCWFKYEVNRSNVIVNSNPSKIQIISGIFFQFLGPFDVRTHPFVTKFWNFFGKKTCQRTAIFNFYTELRIAQKKTHFITGFLAVISGLALGVAPFLAAPKAEPVMPEAAAADSTFCLSSSSASPESVFLRRVCNQSDTLPGTFCCSWCAWIGHSSECRRSPPKC